MKNTNFDLYEVVTNKILDEIEKTGKLNWVKEWKTKQGTNAFPMNGISKKRYEGINFFLLYSSYTCMIFLYPLLVCDVFIGVLFEFIWESEAFVSSEESVCIF